MGPLREETARTRATDAGHIPVGASERPKLNIETVLVSQPTGAWDRESFCLDCLRWTYRGWPSPHKRLRRRNSRASTNLLVKLMPPDVSAPPL